MKNVNVHYTEPGKLRVDNQSGETIEVLIGDHRRPITPGSCNELEIPELTGYDVVDARGRSIMPRTGEDPVLLEPKEREPEEVSLIGSSVMPGVFPDILVADALAGPLAFKVLLADGNRHAGDGLHELTLGELVAFAFDGFVADGPADPARTVRDWNNQANDVREMAIAETLAVLRWHAEANAVQPAGLTTPPPGSGTEQPKESAA